MVIVACAVFAAIVVVVRGTATVIASLLSSVSSGERRGLLRLMHLLHLLVLVVLVSAIRLLLMWVLVLVVVV